MRPPGFFTGIEDGDLVTFACEGVARDHAADAERSRRRSGLWRRRRRFGQAVFPQP